MSLCNAPTHSVRKYTLVMVIAAVTHNSHNMIDIDISGMSKMSRESIRSSFQKKRLVKY